MGRVSRDARLTFIQLWTLADDEGRLRGNSRMLASLLFPYDDDAKDLIDVWLLELEKESCIVRYKIGGDSYIQLCNWLIHQKIDKPSKSKIPAFDESSRILANPREVSSGDQGSRTKDQKEPLSGNPDDEDDEDPEDESGDEVQESDSVKEVLAHLNERTGKNFRMVESNARLIRSRLAEDVTVEQVKAVIDAKVKKWAKDKKMSGYLRPKTLFNATNFEQYLAELPRQVSGAMWWTAAGFENEWDAMNAGCTEHNARFFKNGVRATGQE